MKPVAVAIILSALSTHVAAQWLNHPTPGIARTSDGKPNLMAPTPRTPDGKPDLSGLWTRTSRTVVTDLKPVQSWVDPLVQQRGDRSHLPPDLHGQPRVGDRPQSELDGLLGGALGRRHAGRGEHRIQRPN